MAEITNTQSKTITLRNRISVDGTNTVTQTFTIDSTNGAITRTEPILNSNLYKANREEIREIMSDFEDYAYEQQDDLIAELGLENSEETIEISDE